jgi:putative transposase
VRKEAHNGSVASIIENAARLLFRHNYPANFFYVRYGVSYRDFEEIIEERGVNVDHATLTRWVIRYAPTIAAKAHSQKRNTNRSWRMDETYIKVKGKWVYLYRAVASTSHKSRYVKATSNGLTAVGIKF